MQFTISALTAIFLAASTLTAAMPSESASKLARRQGVGAPVSFVEVTYIGAADAQYSASVETGYSQDTNNALSISHISASGGSCTHYGIDGGVFYTSEGQEYIDVGPPQTIVSSFCEQY